MTDAELEKMASEIIKNTQRDVVWGPEFEVYKNDIRERIEAALRTVRDSVTALERSKMGPERNSGLGAVQLCYGAPFQLPSDFNKIHDAYIEKGHQSNLYKAELKHFYDWLRSQIKTVQPEKETKSDGQRLYDLYTQKTVPAMPRTIMLGDGRDLLKRNEVRTAINDPLFEVKPVLPISDEELDCLSSEWLIEHKLCDGHDQTWKAYEDGYRAAEARILGGTK